MGKKSKVDPVLKSIEHALSLGEFISYNNAWDFIRDLEDVKESIDDLIESNPQRAIKLYEVFLHGCTEKIEEIDDSGGNMGMFFSDLFSSWVVARQKAKCPPEETLQLIDKWNESDNYGLFHEIEKDLISVFDKATLSLLKSKIIEEIDKTLKSKKGGDSYSFRYRKELIRLIYLTKKDAKSYLELLKRIDETPKDCENIAKIYLSKKKYQDSFDWVEKGLKLSSQKTGRDSYSAYKLKDLRKELLTKLGKKDEALADAWADFKKHPSSYSYSDLMKFVPAKEKKQWKEKVLNHVKDGQLKEVFDICMKTKEYTILVDRVLKCEHQTLENLSHYTTEKAASALSKKYPEAAVKIYRALGVRIVNSKKSEYYQESWNHLEKAKKLYQKLGKTSEWEKLVETLMTEHSRKTGFMSGFKEIVNETKKTKKTKLSLAQRAQKRWSKK